MPRSRFGLLPFRSPLLRESSLFLWVLRCFSSPRARQHGSTPCGASVSPEAGCPIRSPLDHPVPASPQSVSPRGRVLPRHRAPKASTVCPLLHLTPKDETPSMSLFPKLAMRLERSRPSASIAGPDLLRSQSLETCVAHHRWLGPAPARDQGAQILAAPLGTSSIEACSMFARSHPPGCLLAS